MMRSMYSAVSGLKTHQTRMDVIGNNIANVNTEAFKASDVRFSEIMYQTISSASGGSGVNGIGGVNAKQIGLGVSTASTSISITSAGAAETTGNPFDLKLSDSQTTNFFIVSDGTNTMFTRAGSFYVDGNGYLCMSSTGYKLMGWQVDPDTGEIRKDTVSALQVMSAANQTSAPESTTLAYASGVLDKNDADVQSDAGYVMTVGIYDKLGYSYTAKFAVKPNENGEEGQYTVELTDLMDSNGVSVIKDPTDETGETYLIDPATLFGAVAEDGTGTGKESLIFDTNKGTFISIGSDENNTETVTLRLSTITTNTVDANTGENGSNFSDVEIDFTRCMNYNNGGTSSMKMLRGNTDGDGTGKKLGALTGLTVDSSGKIYGSYDNGNTVLLCQVAAAQFANASGLEKVGDNCYQTTLNSGEFDGIGIDITADGSTMSTGELEMSNVDLSAEFTDMIVTQRGFQANSRVITVSDTLLEELINLKR
ncbi:MAG: flagellar hook-basal body complex protein [Agathobacter sp.]|nr:flagellar hook-basal body complex protein [Agathobacter sp.]